jgi:hypothetical protein
MHRMRIYVDTSVFGGAFDEEFALPSQRFLELVKQGRCIILISPITLAELQGAPDNVKRLIESMPPGSLEEVKINQEVAALADAYIASGVLASQMKNDALHVAAATAARADAIISWNFKHIVNFGKILKFNGVNITNGYSQIAIYSPLEMAMTTKTKTFDCIEMKRRVQEDLRSEYEKRKKEFASYEDFLNAKADQSSWVRQVRERTSVKG